jgi:FG-GAP-like repeat
MPHRVSDGPAHRRFHPAVLIGLALALVVALACVAAPRAAAQTAALSKAAAVSKAAALGAAKVVPTCPVQDPDNDPIDGPLPYDVNGDFVPDIVVGVPGRRAVDVRYTGVGNHLLSQSSVPGSTGRGFGSAIDYADVNGDGCAEIAIGTPGTGMQAGHVTIVYGPVGSTAHAPLTITPADSRPGDRFGAAVSFGEHDLSGVTVIDLWVGAPGHAVTGHANAGVLYHYIFTPAGQPALLQELTENRGDIPGRAESQDGFGAVLAPARDGVVVGMPDRTVGKTKQAGAIDRIAINDHSGLLAPSQYFSQATAGVPGAVATGNHFGASLSSLAGAFVAVGVPNAKVGSARQAGAVITFAPTSGTARTIKPAKYYTQNSPGVLGVAERDDHFGAAVARGDFACGQLAVGVPGEDIGAVTNAGMVDEIDVENADRCPSGELLAGHGLTGHAQANADIGRYLGVLPEYGADEDTVDGLLIGAPGRTVAGATQAGVTYYWRGKTATTLTMTGGSRAGARYGSVFAPS